MDPQSPPKRMTRARAAAKAADTSSTRTTKIVTAATRAKAARTTTTSAKRKLRSEDIDQDDDDHDELDTEPQPTAMKATRPTRGRPKKVAVEEQPASEPKSTAAPARATRGRPAKKVAPEPAKSEPVKVARTTRAKKVQPEDEAANVSTEPVKKTTTRARSGTTTKSTTVKKTVKFEEPEKENIIPAATSKSKATAASSDAATGLKAKPVRRAAAVTKAGRATRTTKTYDAKDEKPAIPLSPKKVTQVAACRDMDSDDELGVMEETRYKPLLKSPVKPPTSARNEPKPTEPLSPERSEAGAAPRELSSIILGSPARRPPPSPLKDTMKSPARRLGPAAASLEPPSTDGTQKANPTSFKVSLLQSPAKRPQSPVKSSQSRDSANLKPGSPFKLSLLGSPAKRPFSPAKASASPQRQESDNLDGSPVPKPTLLATPLLEDPFTSAKAHDIVEEELEVALAMGEEKHDVESPKDLEFPGRLSAVLPRHADPALKDTLLAVPEIAEAKAAAETVAESDFIEDLGDPMEVDELTAVPIMEAPVAEEVVPQQSALPSFSLRQKDMNPYDEADSESDDEPSCKARRSAQSLFGVPATACPGGSLRTPKSHSTARKSTGGSMIKRRTTNFGFTPLADQLSGWKASSPLKTGYRVESDKTPVAKSETALNMNRGEPSMLEESPARSTYFDDEMSVRPAADCSHQAEFPREEGFGEDVETPVFEEITPTEEDMALAAEANEMSTMEPDRLGVLVEDQYDDSTSEASQEYGDENSIPIDPTLLGAKTSPGVPATTPKRSITTREFHTVSKVPLKPADESSPRPVIRKRSYSISRLPMSTNRPTGGLTRSATVISYSPSKKERQQNSFEAALADHAEGESQRAGSVPPETPSKSDAGWSVAGTPARTPKRDVDPALLRGAVVFVDVHTSEGADASGIFVELLTQMGAKCVKSWPWNPSSPPPKDGHGNSTSRIGITHVVYKDGGKRTMEKVRESGGVVQCVGVSWVLDCERENEWLDEAPYYIDTGLVPRGGARRRKSMEPKALASLNGVLMSTPMKTGHSNQARECHTAPSTPANRRDSGLWMRTPEDDPSPQDKDAEGEDEDAEWDMSGMLTPVPKTPAPETIARFAADVTPDTPSEFDDDESVGASREELMMRTCPPKSSKYQVMGDGILSPEKDQGVMMRLMAARRKSLQFAPKIGSPLARTWN